jgi:hypothetical protein
VWQSAHKSSVCDPRKGNARYTMIRKIMTYCRREGAQWLRYSCPRLGPFLNRSDVVCSDSVVDRLVTGLWTGERPLYTTRYQR